MIGPVDHGNDYDIHYELRAIKTSVRVVDGKLRGGRGSRPCDSDITPFASLRGRVVVTPFELCLIITESELDTLEFS
jgi:hypothetical protein